MDALKNLRTEIKTYFPDSAELLLGRALAGQPRFNFYFEIGSGLRFLLYLNWDGDGNGFTLKCLEFADTDTLGKLCSSYPENGSKVFNVGQPRSTIFFKYLGENRVWPQSARGVKNFELRSEEIPCEKLLACLNPLSELP